MNSVDKFDVGTINNFPESDEKFQEFLAIKIIKPSTIQGYKTRIKEYCLAIGLTPSEFIKEAEYEEEKRIAIKKRKIKSHLIKYVQYLREKNYKETSISNYLIYVKAFYTTFDVELPKLPFKLNMLPKKDYKEWINKDDIKKAVNYSNKKYKAIILLMASSGMGSAEVRSLIFSDFIKSLEEYLIFPVKNPYNVEEIRNNLPSNQHIIPTWHIKRVKTDESFYTFSSPESVEAILDYIEYRESRNKPVLGLDEPLFIGVKPGDPLNKYTITSAFQKINDDAGFKAIGNKRYFTSHELRRFFSDQTFKAGMQERHVTWLRGDKPKNSTFNRYVKPDPKKLKIEYMEKALPCISIESVKIREIDENAYSRLKKLENENLKLQKRLTENSEIFKDRVDEIENIKDILKMMNDPEIKSSPELREKVIKTTLEALNTNVKDAVKELESDQR